MKSFFTSCILRFFEDVWLFLFLPLSAANQEKLNDALKQDAKGVDDAVNLWLEEIGVEVRKTFGGMFCWSNKVQVFLFSAFPGPW